MINRVRYLAASASLSVAVVANAGIVGHDLPVELRLSSSLCLPKIPIDATGPATIATLGTASREMLDQTGAIYFLAEPNDRPVEMASWIIGCRVVGIPGWAWMIPDELRGVGDEVFITRVT